VVEPTSEDEVAEIVEVPTPAPVASPAAVMVAAAALDELHVAALVRF
jgi:hypothetical protein